MDNYKFSNKITTVALNKFDKKIMKKLLSDKGDRQVNGQALLDYLCDKFKIAHVHLTVADKNRVKKGRGTTHGFIRMGLNLKKNSDTLCKSKYIVVYNKTAVRGQTVSIKEFTDTLLHEFIHHYDIQFLKMINSIHSAGFYKRISDLKAKLV